MSVWSADRTLIALRANASLRLRRVGGIGLLFLELGGCMTLGSHERPPDAADSASLPAVSEPAPAVAVSAVMSGAEISPPVKPLPQARRPREHRVVEIPHQKALPSVDPDHLIGLTPDAVRQLLGPPARIESYDLSRAWVYASGGCSFRLFFYPNLNTASFRVLKYGGSNGNGELMDVSDVCIRRILTEGKDAPAELESVHGRIMVRR